MKIGLGAKLSTGMTLTPQMQQAIRLLQLSSLELEQEVQLKLDSNPLLERVEEWEHEPNDSLNDDERYLNEPDDTFDSIDIKQRADSDELADVASADTSLDDKVSYDLSDEIDRQNYDDNAAFNHELWQHHTHSNEPSYDDDWQDDSYQDYGQDAIDSATHFANRELEMAVDTQWDEVYTHEPTGLARIDTDELEDDYKFSTQGNIQDHVRWQLNFKHLSDIEKMIAEYLIDSMDERGFINISTEELFHSFDMMLTFYENDDIELTPEDIEVVIKHVQSCEPLGVGARDLSECLLIQLKRLPNDIPYLEKAKKLLAHPAYFANNNINALLKATGLHIDDIEPCLKLLRTLDPNPALSYQQSQRRFDFAPESYDIPDVLVSYQEQHGVIGWQVRLNPDTLPKLRVNQEYANLITRQDNSEQGLYLKEQLNDARLFIRSIEERNQNLLKVATCIVKRQQAFFEQGVTAMQPMILKDVADAVSLHESTVSRITTSKTMLTPKGLFSLKYFFSSQVSGNDGDGVSSTAISAMIKQMIEAEDPKKPLSDSTIMENLKANGIDIARRTVSKYRESMNIGSSTQRKRRF